MNKNKLNLFFIRLFILVTLLNFILMGIRIENKSLDHDETQHVHIAWHMLNGKIIYKDFFDNHGPLFPITNVILWEIFNLKPEFKTLFFFRGMSFLYMILILILTYKIGRKLFNPFIGSLSIAILSSLTFFQDKVIEIRPDGLQNVFWLLGAYLILLNFEKRKPFLNFIAGISFGLMLLTNFKSALGLTGVFIFFILNYFLYEKNIKLLIQNFAHALSGIFLVFFPFCLYFLFFKALRYFFFSNFLWNLRLILSRHMTGSTLASANLSIFFNQKWFVFLLFLGLFLIIFSIILKEKYKKEKPKVFFLIITFTASLFLLLNIHTQAYIIFTPLLSIIAAYGVYQFKKSLELKFFLKGFLISFIIIFLIISNMFLFSLKNTPLYKTSGLTEQEKLTGFILNNTNRTDPILYFWSSCGGYMFNEDLDYFWPVNLTRIRPQRPIVELLKEKDVKFIIGGIQDSKETHEYIKTNYYQKNSCLWIKKE